MSKYYYLVATLPSLKAGEGSFMTKDLFLSECGKWLSPCDLEYINMTDAYGISCERTGCKALDVWNEFDRSLRKDLAASRSRSDAQDQRVSEISKSILTQSTPLLTERRFEEVRLAFIRDNIGRYFFDINWLVLYFLKLQIVERLSVFNKDKGENFFYKICEVKYE